LRNETFPKWNFCEMNFCEMTQKILRNETFPKWIFAKWHTLVLFLENKLYLLLKYSYKFGNYKDLQIQKMTCVLIL